MIKIKNTFPFLIVMFLLNPCLSYGQVKETEIQNDVPDFLGDYIADVETSEKAKTEATDILNKNQALVKLQKNEKNMRQKADEQKKILQERIQQTKKWQQSETEDNSEETLNSALTATVSDEDTTMQPSNDSLVLQKAPLGLFWNISEQQAAEKGFILQPVRYEGYHNVYKVQNTEQKNNTFSNVYAAFGYNNRLWSIIAQSTPMQDNKNAARILELYRKYYNALKQKYGNAKEFFTPYQHKQSTTDEKGNIVEETKESVLGGDTFLQELQNNQTSLYATFDNSYIGAILSVFADDDGKTFITLIYKKFDLMKQENNAEKQKEIPLEDL